MSALIPKADIESLGRKVRFVPIADMAPLVFAQAFRLY